MLLTFLRMFDPLELELRDSCELPDVGLPLEL